MTTSSNVLIGIVVLGWILARQLSVRPVGERMTLSWILLAAGVIETSGYLQQHGASGVDLALLIGSAAIGGLLAIARAHTMRVWVTATGAVRQGTVVTAALWVVGIGQHLLLDAFVHDRALGSVSLMAYFGLTLLVQHLVLMVRAQRLQPVSDL